MDKDDDGFMYRGERYRKRYLDAFQELYRTAEDANGAIGDNQPRMHYPSPNNPENRKSGGKDGI